MGRSRKMPPLFEVMRETDRKGSEAREGHPPGVVLPRPTAPSPERPQTDRETAAKLRLSHQAPTNGTGQGHEHAPVADGAPTKGVMLPLPLLLGGIGVLVAVIAVIAMIAFNAGANRERSELLPTDGGGPPPITNRSAPEDAGVVQTPATNPPAVKNEGVKPSAGLQPVYGDDPRVDGTNYLIVETLLFDDAMASAEFLTKNGVACVVVVPEGVNLTPSELQKQPRGSWQVIVREGFTRDEYRANAARADAIERSVKQLGRRWKDDHKGTTNFSRCYWKKFGK